ncbi:MAG TPA: rhamnogalacturonan acetylesterase [Bacteroidales bacterium]
MKALKLISLIILTGLLVNFTNTGKVTIYTIGDSTMANKDLSQHNPERGWGQMFQQFFDDQVIVDNWAKNGRSSKSFMTEGLWKGVLEKLKPGDFVFIQFGHNDSKPDSARHTDPHTTYKANLTKYITETRAKGANPVLLTSVVRRKFDANENLEDTHGEYLVVVRELAKEMNVPLIDMEQKSRKLVQQLGPEESKKLYMWIEPGVSEKFPKGDKDDTHFQVYGATKMAGLVVEGIKELNLSIASHIIKTPQN